MKKLLITLLALTSLSSFAALEYSADEIIDKGDYAQVNWPKILGCATGECYGGEHHWYFRPSYNKNKICRKLGFKRYIRKSRVIGSINEFDRYSKLVYHVLYRNGYPGAPEGGKQVKAIKSIECSK